MQQLLDRGYNVVFGKASEAKADAVIGGSKNKLTFFRKEDGVYYEEDFYYYCYGVPSYFKRVLVEISAYMMDVNTGQKVWLCSCTNEDINIDHAISGAVKKILKSLPKASNRNKGVFV